LKLELQEWPHYCIAVGLAVFSAHCCVPKSFTGDTWMLLIRLAACEFLIDLLGLPVITVSGYSG